MIRVVVPTIVVSAALQALLVVGDPVPQLSGSFVARTVASAVIVVLAIWIIVGAASASGRPTLGLLAAVVVAVLIGTAAGVLNPILPIVVAMAALPLLSSIASGSVTGVGGTLSHSPLRSSIGMVLVAVVSVIAWVAALLLGFFVTGPIAAGVTWLVFGAGTALLAFYWASLHRRAH